MVGLRSCDGARNLWCIESLEAYDEGFVKVAVCKNPGRLERKIESIMAYPTRSSPGKESETRTHALAPPAFIDLSVRKQLTTTVYVDECVLCSPRVYF